MDNVSCWLASSLVRVYPNSVHGAVKSLSMLAARGERVSFQVALRNDTPEIVKATAAVDAPAGIQTTIRRVGFVPVAHFTTGTPLAELDGIGHIPGYVPDPLFPECEAAVAPFENTAFWVTLHVSADAAPGARRIGVSLTAGDAQLPEMVVNLKVSPVGLNPADDFPVTHWFYADALCDWYKVQPFEERFWQIVEPYMADLAAHGNNCQYVPLFTPPTDGVKRPTQLMRIATPAEGKYEFDFTDVLRWVKLARQCGARWFEWTHLFTQWGAAHAIRMYRNNADPESLLWPPETPGVSETYRNFLSQFLPVFKRFLDEEGLFDHSLFHISDEPETDEAWANYRKDREFIRELAPWMRVLDAMSRLEHGKEGLCDTPIASIGTHRQYVEAGIDSYAYFCCGPRGRFVNRFVDTPLPKIRMTGWLLQRFRAKGFLHWGYNYWYKQCTQQMIDPFTNMCGGSWPGIPSGDTFVVFPGPEGPIDSIRWEVFGESMQDLALLRTCCIAHDDPHLAGLKGYDEFPRTEEWLKAARARLLNA